MRERTYRRFDLIVDATADIGVRAAAEPLVRLRVVRGLAERRRRTGDRRTWEVAITPKGRRTLERGRRLVAQVEDEVLAGLTTADRRQLLTLLRRALVSAPPQPPWSSHEGD